MERASHGVSAWRRRAGCVDGRGIGGLIGKGVAVFIIRENLIDRSLRQGDVIDGLKQVLCAGIPGLFAGYDQVRDG